MRTLVLLGVAVLALMTLGGCRKRVPNSGRPNVNVPATQEGLACKRQCQVVMYSCAGGKGQNQRFCEGEQYECLKTCPGARWDDGRLIHEEN